MSCVKDIKQFIRENIYNLRKNISKKSKNDWDLSIFKNVISCHEYICSDLVFIYVSKSIEVNTYNIIRHALKEKKVFIPICNINNCTMDFYNIKSFDDLEIGYSNIYEPIKEKCTLYTKQWELSNFNKCTKKICIVPGLCFDISGYRIGFGKGYYDRFLKTFPDTKIGICYSEYVFNKLPISKNDVQVDKIITEG